MYEILLFKSLVRKCRLAVSLELAESCGFIHKFTEKYSKFEIPPIPNKSLHLCKSFSRKSSYSLLTDCEVESLGQLSKATVTLLYY